MPTLLDVLAGLGVAAPAAQGAPDRIFAHITHDSRDVALGDLYVARRGETLDGHAFIAEALQKGATAILAERVVEAGRPVFIIDARRGGQVVGPGDVRAPALILVDDSQKALERVAAWWRSRLAVEVYGVTGSVGKTTTKEMMAAVLGQRCHILKSERSLNTDVGMALTLLNLLPRHEKAVLEMGMYKAGEIALLCQMARPRCGVVTNVGPTHLERLGSIEAIADAKAELVEALPADGVAVLNGDDPRVRAMAGRTKAEVITFGLGADCEVRGSSIRVHGLEGISFDLHLSGQTLPIVSSLIGRHSVYTALAAAASGLAGGLTAAEIAAGLRQAPEKLRLAPVLAANGATIIKDTYNAAPASVMAALDLLAEMPGRRVAVLGDMRELGSYTEAGHRQVGVHAARLAHILVTVGDYGRLIGEEALANGMPAEKTLFADDCDAAVAVLKRLIQPGDYVLVKGSRSLHMEDIVEEIAR